MQRATLWDRVAAQNAGPWLILVGYILLWCALLLWSSLYPSSFWLANTATALPASQIMSAFVILTPFIIPFVVYYPIMQAEGSSNSFPFTQSSAPASTGSYLKQVVTCSALTLISLSSLYALFAFMIWLGLSTKDLAAQIILGPSFLTFVVLLTLFTSATLVGLAISRFRAIRLVATAITLLAVIVPFLLSEMVTGITFENHLIRFVKAMGNSQAFSIFFLLSSILVGSFFSWVYGRNPL